MFTLDLTKLGVVFVSVLILVFAFYGLIFKPDMAQSVQVALISAISAVAAYWFSHSLNRPAD